MKVKNIKILKNIASVFKKVFWVSLSWFLQTSVMKRMKRFVLAERSEKNAVWKSSDNLLAGIVRMNSENNEDKEVFSIEPTIIETEKTAGLT